MCDMRERGVATDRGKGPEFGNEVGMHCLQDGLILSQAKCMVLVLSPAKCLVPNIKTLSGLKLRPLWRQCNRPHFQLQDRIHTS